MSLEFTLGELTACGAHRRGHFRLSSGLHSADYLQCALYLAEPAQAARAGVLLAAAARAADMAPAVVVAPALGAVIIGHETARALGVPCLFTERVDGEMALRRGFAVAPGTPALVVEDVVTTGRSTAEVVTLLAAAGAETVGLASIVNRSGRANPFAPRPYRALLAVEFETWPPDECPLCRAGVPVEKPGSRPVA